MSSLALHNTPHKPYQYNFTGTIKLQLEQLFCLLHLGWVLLKWDSPLGHFHNYVTSHALAVGDIWRMAVY